MLLRCDTGKVRLRFGGMGRFKGWVSGQQCTGVNLISINVNGQYMH